MDARRQRGIAKAQLTRAENIVKRDLEVIQEAELPITTVERHREDMLAKWQKAQDIHDEYTSCPCWIQQLNN